MPPECPANSAVIIQQVDATTWIVKRAMPATNLKILAIPVVDHLPEDRDWDKVESAFGHAAAKNIRPET